MAGFEKGDIPMLSDTNGQSMDEHVDSQFQKLAYRTRSASISSPMNSMESYQSEAIHVGHTGPLRSERRTPFIQMSGPLYVSRKPENLFWSNQAITGCKTVEPLAGNFPSSKGKDQDDLLLDIYTNKNEHLLRSGQLGMCNDPYCTTCPINYHNFKAAQQKNPRASSVFDPKFHNALYGDAKSWARRFYSLLQQYIPGVMNPHAKVVQQWNKFFVISCLVAIFVDPLFFFLWSILNDNWCVVIDQTMTTTIVVFRSFTDLIYFFHMLLQFRLAFVAPESRVVGAGELVDDPKKIALNYIRGFFFVDLFVVQPLPQQISTLAGNQTPTHFVWEVLFTMLGLLLVALLIGNMQDFLQARGQRRLEMSVRRRDIEQWMSHRRLSEELRRQVRQVEWYNWAAMRGVNEEVLFENLPEDLQRDIRCHLFKFVKKVRIFALMDEPVLDAIRERVRQKIYIKGSKILYQGGLIDKMVFIVRGKTESKGENGNVVTLSEGDVCGEELLSWCLEHSSVNKDGRKRRIPGQRLLSSGTVSCLTNVEAFSLRAADLEEVTSLFTRFLRNPRVQGAIRYESPYWRSRAAILIQVAWRYRRKHLNRADTSQSNHMSSVVHRPNTKQSNRMSSAAHQGTSSMVPFHVDYGHHMKL